MNKEKNKSPLLAHISTRLLGKEKYTVMTVQNDVTPLSDNAANSQAQIPLDLSSSLSVLEDSSDSQSERGQGPDHSSSSIEKSPSRSQNDQVSVIMSVSSSQDHQKNYMVIQIDTRHRRLLRPQDWIQGVTDMFVSETSEVLVQQPADLPHGGVGGGQSLETQGGVHTRLRRRPFCPLEQPLSPLAY